MNTFIHLMQRTNVSIISHYMLIAHFLAPYNSFRAHIHLYHFIQKHHIVLHIHFSISIITNNISRILNTSIRNSIETHNKIWFWWATYHISIPIRTYIKAYRIIYHIQFSLIQDISYQLVFEQSKLFLHWHHLKYYSPTTFSGISKVHVYQHLSSTVLKHHTLIICFHTISIIFLHIAYFKTHILSVGWYTLSYTHHHIYYNGHYNIFSLICPSVLSDKHGYTFKEKYARIGRSDHPYNSSHHNTYRVSFPPITPFITN